jgi:hypothetical protein
MLASTTRRPWLPIFNLVNRVALGLGGELESSRG